MYIPKRITADTPTSERRGLDEVRVGDQAVFAIMEQLEALLKKIEYHLSLITDTDTKEL